MKQLFLFGLALLLSGPALAQRGNPAPALPKGTAAKIAPGGGFEPPVYAVPEQTPWSHVVDSMLQYVDKSQIPSGILYDRALPLAALPYFDRFRNDTTSVTHLRQAYLELFIAAYNQQTFPLTPSQLREKAEALTRRDSVPLAVLDYRLHYLDTMAVYNNQFVLQNGLYRDVAGRSSSPYTERLLTLAAPLARSVRQQARFYVAPALLLGNRGRVVSSLVVSFDNGAAPVTCVPGQVVAVNYTTAGEKVLRFTVNFANGTQALARARLTVLPQPASRGITSHGPTFPILPFNARDPFMDYNGVNLHGRGEALVVLNNTTSQGEGAAYQLRNPVVIMDGFDPNDESKLQENLTGPSIYKQLVESGILDALELVQRDLVILNFPKSRRLRVGGGQTTDDVDGGTDFVERNAYVLETLLNSLKARIYVNAAGQRDKYAVIGPSMGGLISRYALAHMEQQQQLLTDAGSPADPWWDHNTATWLSFDVPHMGANIPLSDQHLLAFFKDTQSARDNLEQRLDAVAARQFLVAHHTYAGAGVGGAPGYRDRFMLALRDNGERGSFGYPVHLRRVALANGKMNGQLPPSGDGTPCGNMLDVNVRTRAGAAVVNTILGFFGFSYGTSNPNLIATSTLRFLPNAGSNCQIFYGLTNQTSGLSWGRTGPTATQSVYVTGGSQASWDLAPGGTRNTQQQLHDQFEAAGAGEPFRVDVTNVRPNHCFIPTVSALGFQYQSTGTYQNTGSLPNPYTNLLPRDMVCNNEIPFDDFYAPPTANSGHVTVADAAAQAFLIRELTPQVARPVLLAAPTELCAGGLFRTFTVKDCPPPGSNRPATTYTWTVTQGARFGNGLLTTTGTTVTLGGDAGVDNSVTLTVQATRAGYVPSAPVTLAIEVGTVQDLAIVGYGTPNYVSFNPASSTYIVCQNDLVTYHLNAQNYDRSSILWFAGVPRFEIPARAAYNPSISFDGQTTMTRNVTNGVSYFSVYATAINLCTGVRETATTPQPASPFISQAQGMAGRLVLRIDNSYNCFPSRPSSESRPLAPSVAAYPNPANGSLLVKLEAVGETAGTTDLRLYNSQGRLVYQQAFAGTRCAFATANLSEGFYYLIAATASGQVLRQHLEIKH